jgi:hypothetical protein
VSTVYAETSFFSESVTIRKGPIDTGRRLTSENWWKTQARKFDIVISNEVIRELSAPDFPDAVRDSALAMLGGLRSLDINSDVYALAKSLVDERVMPAPAVQGDAIHVAVSAIHGIDYLLTWNQKHLANPNKRTHLSVICARFRVQSPQIVTPDLLIIEDDDGSTGKP